MSVDDLDNVVREASDAAEAASKAVADMIARNQVRQGRPNRLDQIDARLDGLNLFVVGLIGAMNQNTLDLIAGIDSLDARMRSMEDKMNAFLDRVSVPMPQGQGDERAANVSDDQPSMSHDQNG